MTIKVTYFNNTSKTFETIEECIAYPNYDDIQALYCANNNLNKLPMLPSKLVILDVQRNNLDLLPALPDTLKYLYACRNKLTKLPNYLPSSLIELFVEYNKLSEIPNGIINLNRKVYFYYTGNNIDIDNQIYSVKKWLYANKVIMDGR